MRKISFILLTLFTFVVINTTFTACNSDDDNPTSSIDSKLSSLYTKTDYYIQNSTGSGSSTTSDGQYLVTKIGKLVVVKKNTNSNTITYSQIASALKERYKNKYNVKDVFVNNGGTVTIDCRY